MKRIASTGFMTIYWIALPLSALGMSGLGWVLVAPGATYDSGSGTGFGAAFLSSILLVVLIIWRLWTHARARRLAAERMAALPEAPSTDENLTG
ncbi:MAG: hypothetical protein EON88_29440 [Brevundimonas sp.]|nr:MAG: hypothetical protein EON88_29440 [Brevundimonas sp.]